MVSSPSAGPVSPQAGTGLLVSARITECHCFFTHWLAAHVVGYINRLCLVRMVLRFGEPGWAWLTIPQPSHSPHTAGRVGFALPVPCACSTSRHNLAGICPTSQDLVGSLYPDQLPVVETFEISTLRLWPHWWPVCNNSIKKY